MVNLVVDLRGTQFGADALARSVSAMEKAGFTVELGSPGDDAFLAWIDEEFGGTWSSEAFAGNNVIAKRDGRFAGFATYGAHGLPFSWLRGLGSKPGVGIFGPFGVAPAFRAGSDRGDAVGPHLLTAALGGLAGQGFAQALVPAVGHEKLIAYYRRHSGARVAETFDKAQWRRRTFRAVVLASGSGTNFQSVIDGVADQTLPLDLALLLSNRSGAYALERARAAGVPATVLPWDRKAQSREHYDAAILEAAQRAAPDLVLLLGWMHLLPDSFVEKFPHTINIHPAFLPIDQRRNDVGFPDGSVTPAFRGPRAVEDALAWGSRWVGASAHRITLEADRGPVLVRKPMAIRAGDTFPAVMERLHPLEHRALSGGIMRWVYER